MEIFRSSNEYYVQLCKDGGRKERNRYSGANGKNKRWTVTRKSGEIAAYVDGELKFKRTMSSSYCTNSDWRSYWTRNVAKVVFDDNDKASVQFRNGKL